MRERMERAEDKTRESQKERAEREKREVNGVPPHPIAYYTTGPTIS